MLTDAELEQARSTQEMIMTDRGILRMPGAGTHFDDVTKKIVANPGVTFYSGKMLVQSREANVNQLLVGDDRETMQDFVIKVPWDVTLPSDVIECVVQDSRDPDMIGRVITVSTVGRSSWVTCRRMIGTVSGVVERGGITDYTGLWVGDGEPGTIPGAVPGQGYLDQLTGNLYALEDAA